MELREISLLGVRAVTIAWESDRRRRVHWPWPDLRDRFYRDPARFDLEIRCRGQICAFALGRPSNSRSHCSLYFVEGSPDPAHPLCKKVLPVVLTALERYCVAIGAAEMRIVDPLPPLIPLYVGRYGFALADAPKHAPYCAREVGS